MGGGGGGGGLSRAWQYYPILKKHVLDTLVLKNLNKDTYKKSFRLSYPAAGRVMMPTTLPMSIHSKWKISFTGGRSRINMYLRNIILQEKGGPFVLISTHMVQMRMEWMIDENLISVFRSQISNYKS